MKISYEWLREYVNTKIRAQNLCHILTMAGHEVTSVEPQGNDFIFDMEITPNRADCLSHIGIAREIAAAVNKKLRIPQIKIKPKSLSEDKQIKVSVEDKIACPRYSARVIKDVDIAPSPKWLIKKLQAMSLRPVNNIVDITNFILYDTGQPLHAFDLDKIKGAKIIVRRARQLEKIVTIDGIERQLLPHMLVIADAEGPVAIAGVMGAKTTEVTEGTKNILLESAYFDPVVIRKTALSLGLSTDSSYRFERGVDITAVTAASDRAAHLINDIAKGTIYGMEDIGSKQKQLSNITLYPDHLNKILGTQIKPNDIKKILQLLGFKVKGDKIFSVTTPSFRDDVTREADLVEEVARIYGYENIPSQPPAVISTEQEPKSKDIIKKITMAREILASSGFNEAITYSLISRQMHADMALPDEGVIGIQNPLSREQEIMRRSLLPGLIKAISYNISRQVQDVKIFELSNVYFIKEGAYNEEPFLSIAEYNKTHKRQKKGYASNDISKFKGIITSLSERLGIAKLGFEKVSHPIFVEDESIAVLSDNIMLGAMGRIKEDILDRFDIKGGVYAAELNFKTITTHSNPSRFFKPLPRFPYSYRDVSFAVNMDTTYKEIIDFVKSKAEGLIESIELLSEYYGDQIPKGQRALAIRLIYRSKEKTLTEEEINKIDNSIRKGIVDKFTATLR